MKEYIERAAVLKVLEEYYPGADERLHIVKDITSIPAADVAGGAGTGRWIFEPGKIPYCSECKEYSRRWRQGRYFLPVVRRSHGQEDEHD